MVDPNSGTTTYAYDLNGQTTSVTSEAGTITMGYDVLGRMLTRTSTDPSSNASGAAPGFPDTVMCPGFPGGSPARCRGKG